MYFIRPGVDVTANQEEISDHETFQLEFDAPTTRWYIRTMQDKYFTLQAGGGVQGGEKQRTANALFDLQWLEDGSVCFKANNGEENKNVLSNIIQQYHLYLVISFLNW